MICLSFTQALLVLTENWSRQAVELLRQQLLRIPLKRPSQKRIRAWTPSSSEECTLGKILLIEHSQTKETEREATHRSHMLPQGCQSMQATYSSHGSNRVSKPL